MVDTITKAAMQDALALVNGKIMVGKDERGFVTGVTINGKSPEDLINCISGTLRRRKPMTTDWSVDAAVLYNNLWSLDKLKNGEVFQIVLTFVNTDPSNANNIGQKITLNECRITDHSVNITESSTFKFSGNAKSWEVADATSL